MKKLARKLSLLLVCVLCLSMFACGKDDDKEEYTITFMNGDKEIGKVTVEEGATIDKADVDKFANQDGFVLKGWYGAASFLEESKLDLATATFDKDKNVYGDFRSTNVKEDTKKYYIVGQSKEHKGELEGSQWAGASVSDTDKEKYLLKKADGVNEFSITMDLYEKDMFQIIADWKWDTQIGNGYVVSPDDTLYKAGEGGLNADPKKSNTEIVKEGNYTITLTTDPDNEGATEVKIVRNGDPKVAREAGAVEQETTAAPAATAGLTGTDPNVRTKGSWKSDWSDIKKLTKVDGTNNWTITMDLTKDTELCFAGYDGDKDTGLIMKEPNVKDDASKKLLTSTSGNNIKVAADGSYTFTVNGDTLDVTITKK